MLKPSLEDKLFMNCFPSFEPTAHSHPPEILKPKTFQESNTQVNRCTKDVLGNIFVQTILILDCHHVVDFRSIETFNSKEICPKCRTIVRDKVPIKELDALVLAVQQQCFLGLEASLFND